MRTGRKPMDLRKRFENFVFFGSPCGCWYWCGPMHPHGYGMFNYKGRSQFAHRPSYEIYKSQIPKGMNVLHECDNRMCVNPDHLFLGTQKDNVHDMMKKGRRSSTAGENHGCSILRDIDIILIKEAISHGFTGASIAKYYKICRSTVSRIKLGKDWKHLKPEIV